MAGIIKAHSNLQLPSAADLHQVAFNFDDMTSRAEQYLQQVRVEAAKIVNEAHGQARQIRADAEKDGQAAAMEAMEQVVDRKLSAQLQTLIPALQKTIDDIQQAKAAWLRHWRHAAVDVAAAIASKVIRSELSQRPEIALNLVKEALELAAGSCKIVVRLYPEDHQNLRGQLDALIAEMGPLAEAQFVADSNITAGGCRVETEFGSLDQQIETQLQRIAQELK